MRRALLVGIAATAAWGIAFLGWRTSPASLIASARLLAGLPVPGERPWLFAATLLAPPSLIALVQGQTTPLILLAVAGSLRAGPRWSGALLAATALRPQLLPLFALVALADRERRVPFVAGVTGVVAASLAVIGPSGVGGPGAPGRRGRRPARAARAAHRDRVVVVDLRRTARAAARRGRELSGCGGRGSLAGRGARLGGLGRGGERDPDRRPAGRVAVAARAVPLDGARARRPYSPMKRCAFPMCG